MKWYMWLLLVAGIVIVTAVVVQSEWYKNWMEKLKSSTESPAMLQRRILDSQELYRQA